MQVRYIKRWGNAGITPELTRPLRSGGRVIGTIRESPPELRDKKGSLDSKPCFRILFQARFPAIFGPSDGPLSAIAGYYFNLSTLFPWQISAGGNSVK